MDRTALTQSRVESAWLSQRPDGLRVASALTVLVLALLVGLAGLRLPFQSPLVVAGAVAVVAALVASLRRPALPLYAAVFVMLLPAGLLSQQIHSFLNRSLPLVALGAFLFDLAMRRRPLFWAPSALLMLGFVVWGCATLLWASDLTVATTKLQVYAIRLVLYLFLLPNVVRTEEGLNGLMGTLALSGWVLIAASLVTVALEGYSPGTRLAVLEMNENGLGIFALAALPGILWRATRPSVSKGGLRSPKVIAFVLLSLIVVAMSGSRGSLLSWLVTLFAFLLWKPTRAWGKISLPVLAVVAVAAPFIFQTTIERLTLRAGGTLLGSREALWTAAWASISQHPWLGVGIGNGSRAVLPYLEAMQSMWDSAGASIHNPPLTIWVEMGLPGLLFYLGVPAAALLGFWRFRRLMRDAPAHPLGPYFAIVLAPLAGYMASWIKGGGMEDDATYFLMLGLLWVPAAWNAREPLSDGDSAPAGDKPAEAVPTAAPAPRQEIHA